MGRVLLDHCRANNRGILNGRAFNDSNTGKFTCAESSVVDCVVCSSHLLMNISYFHVEDFLSLLSDKHCAVSVLLEVCAFATKTEPANEGIHIKRWNDSFSQSFATNVNMELVEYVAVNMSEVETVDKDTINKFNNEIGALIVDAAEKTCGTFTKRTIVPTIILQIHGTNGLITSVKSPENSITDVEKDITWLKIM